jgi:hypothetical protein
MLFTLQSMKQPKNQVLLRGKRAIIMKSYICILLIISTSVANAQIFTQNSANGSITITPKGMQGSTNSSAGYNNVATGTDALKNNTTGDANTANGSRNWAVLTVLIIKLHRMNG